MFHKLVTATNRNTKGTKHALALTKIRLPVLLILDINIESLAFEEDLQITIVLENWVTSNLIQHPLQSSPSGLDKISIESTHGLLLWGRRNNYAGVVIVHGVVEPKEITVSPTDGKLGLAVCFGGSLQSH